jgi:hypothetical protein
VLVLNGIDNYQAGLRTVYYGEHKQALLEYGINQGVKAVDGPEWAGPTLYMVTQIAIPVGATKLANLPAASGTGVRLTGATRAMGAKNPLYGTKYTPKVMNQMAPNPKTGLPDNHGFPIIVDNYAGQGTTTMIKGRDGLLRVKVEVSLPRGCAANNRWGNFFVAHLILWHCTQQL